MSVPSSRSSDDRRFSSSSDRDFLTPKFHERADAALVFQVWESLEQSLIDSVIDPMPSRLQAIVEANG